MSADLAAPPVLSTPDDHILEVPAEAAPRSTLSGDALRTTYDVARTAAEISDGGWTRIALQFPDHMLVDAPRVVESLRHELHTTAPQPADALARRIHILADTSYSACCVDEVAAEHADAQVVVHYGRTCLSPTSRLPVIYVYTFHELDHAAVARAFESEFGAKDVKVVVMADLTLQDHVNGLVAQLRASGYGKVVATDVFRDPAGVIPNRRVSGLQLDLDATKTYSLFHIGDPPSSLLLALQTRFASLHVLSSPSSSTPTLDNPTIQAAGLLRRRFARVLSLASAGVVGILVNTLSVSNYLSSIDLLRDKIAKAGKKSYTVVVGKLNPAKLANFAEVEGWVVVGCWESGLIEDDAGYWRPVVTPFELEVALMSNEERTWGGEWWGGIEKLKLTPGGGILGDDDELGKQQREQTEESESDAQEDGVEGAESLPPDFDLRTGRLISHSRPMRLTVGRTASRRPDAAEEGPGGLDKPAEADPCQKAVTRRAAGEMASIRGVTSPGAEFLRSQRTWQGLGSDFAEGAGEASTVVEEGRSGIARGYRVGDEAARR